MQKEIIVVLLQYQDFYKPTLLIEMYLSIVIVLNQIYIFKSQFILSCCIFAFAFYKSVLNIVW